MLFRKSIPNSGSNKCKAIAKLFERHLSRLMELRSDKEISNTLNAPSTRKHYKKTKY